MMSLLFALACSGGHTATPPPSPAVRLIGERADLQVRPDLIRWDEGSRSLQIEARLAGRGVAERGEPVHVGVTVITEDGQEHDLLVHTLFPASMEQSLLFSTELRSPPKHVLIGAWNDRIEPCDSERPGCREFGFVLDGSLAAFPAGLYTEGMRQRMLPEGLVVRVKGDPGRVAELAMDYAKPFGVSVSTERTDSTLEPGVWAQRRDDLGLAQHLAEPFGLSYAHKEDLDVPVLVVLP